MILDTVVSRVRMDGKGISAANSCARLSIVRIKILIVSHGNLHRVLIDR